MSISLDRSTKSIEKTPAYRADIQGLRAIAVVVVIADHLFGWPSGGFIGVDVFFVISGFLITGLMLREHERTGQISWVGFYKRRVRRIVPAASVCLIVVVAASYFVYLTARFESVKDDAIWSFFFMSNWHFATIGTDYLGADGPVSPLQHFWSLAVEEQFYIVWPVMLILVLGVVGRPLRVRGRSANKALAVVIGVIVAASFAWSVWDTEVAPTWAYFSTFTRGWELAVGALLAVAASRLAMVPASVRPLMSLGGLALIIVSLFVINTKSTFPGPWAALPVVGAALVLSAGVGQQPRYGWVLTNPASVYVGRISYSLYLWHFPVIVMLGAFFAEGSVEYYWWAIGAMSLLAVASFHLVETPARAGRKPDLHSSHRTSRSKWRAAGFTALGVWTLCTLAAVVIALQQNPAAISTASPSSAAPPTVQPVLAGTVIGGVAQTQLSGEIDAALNASAWPTDLYPALNALGRPAMSPEWMKDGCLSGEQSSLEDPVANSERCVYGDPNATKNAVLLGDSVGISYLPGIRAALVPAGYRVHVLTMAQCPVAALTVEKADGSVFEACDEFRQWATDRTIAMAPDLVIVAESLNTLRRLPGDPPTEGGVPQWADAMKVSLTKLSSQRRVVFLAPPPESFHLDDCLTTNSVPSDCISQPGSLYEEFAAAAAHLVPSTGTAFHYIDTQPWFCSAERCPELVANNAVFADQSHLTAAYAQRLGPVLAATLIG